MTPTEPTATRSGRPAGPGAVTPEDLLAQTREVVRLTLSGDLQPTATGDPLEDLVTLVCAVLDRAARAGAPPPTFPSGALRLVVRALLDRLVARAPGHSVEVRVTPFAAVQCVEGPRHTRGTPPNVVEADAATWIRLACGRVSWADAVADGSVRASGERADISGLLPLV